MEPFRAGNAASSTPSTIFPSSCTGRCGRSSSWVRSSIGPLVALIALFFRRYRLAIALLIATVAKLVFERLVKVVSSRQRPGTSIGSDVHLRGDVSAVGESFVSGHAVLIAAIAGLVTPYLPGPMEDRSVGRRRPRHGDARVRRRPQSGRRRVWRSLGSGDRRASQPVPGTTSERSSPMTMATRIEEVRHRMFERRVHALIVAAGLLLVALTLGIIIAARSVHLRGAGRSTTGG